MSALNRSSGIALLSTIWVTAILSILVLSMLNGFSSNTDATHLEAMRIKHTMLHQAGLRYAALHLASPRHQVAPTAIPNRELVLQLDSGQVQVKIENEAGRIDLLKAPPRVLASLFTGHGLSQANANQLAISIQSSLADQPRASYRALRTILASFPKLYQGIITDVSLHNGRAGVHPALASESVLDSIPELSAVEKQQILRARIQPTPSLVSSPVDNPLLTPRLSTYYRISTTTVLDDSRRSTDEIIKMTNQAGILYRVVATL